MYATVSINCGINQCIEFFRIVLTFLSRLGHLQVTKLT